MIIVSVSGLVLALAFVVSGTAKITRPQVFIGALERTPIAALTTAPLSRSGARAVGAVEFAFAAAILLVGGQPALAVAALALVLFALFARLTIEASRASVPCGCYGSTAPATDRDEHRAWLLLAAAAALFIGRATTAGPTAAVASALIAVALAASVRVAVGRKPVRAASFDEGDAPGSRRSALKFIGAGVGLAAASPFAPIGAVGKAFGADTLAGRAVNDALTTGDLSAVPAGRPAIVLPASITKKLLVAARQDPSFRAASAEVVAAGRPIDESAVSGYYFRGVREFAGRFLTVGDPSSGGVVVWTLGPHTGDRGAAVAIVQDLRTLTVYSDGKVVDAPEGGWHPDVLDVAFTRMSSSDAPELGPLNCPSCATAMQAGGVACVSGAAFSTLCCALSLPGGPAAVAVCSTCVVGGVGLCLGKVSDAVACFAGCPFK